jgi:hypothetical protein
LRHPVEYRQPVSDARHVEQQGHAMRSEAATVSRKRFLSLVGQREQGMAEAITCMETAIDPS